MKTVSKQATFNKIVKHLRKQGGKALANWGCAYLNHKGERCAAGCLIPKKQYSKDFEGGIVAPIGEIEQSYYALATIAVSKKIAELGHDGNLVRDMQLIHDNANIGVWEHKFKEVAEKYSLKVPPLCLVK